MGFSGVVAHKAGLCDVVLARPGLFCGLCDVWSGHVVLSRRAMSAAVVVHSPQTFVFLVRTSGLAQLCV